MTMTDIYLRGADRAAIDAALVAAGLIDAEGMRAEGVVLSRIGAVYRATGEIDEDGAPIMAAVEGYHANLRLLRDPTEDELAALEAVTIAPPAVPYRVWFD